MFPSIAAPLSSVANDVQSRALFDLDVRYCDVDADAGTITAASGHVGTFSRGATLASVADANGTTYTALDAQPAWEMRDWDGDGVRESFGLRFGGADRLSFPVSFKPQALTVLIEFIELSNPGTFGWALSSPALAAPRLYSEWNAGASAYLVAHNDGSTERTANTGAVTAIGDRIALRIVLNTNGSVQIWQSRNGAAETTGGASASSTLAAAWVADARVWIGSLGNGTSGATWVRRLKIAAGVQTLATMQARR